MEYPQETSDIMRPLNIMRVCTWLNNNAFQQTPITYRLGSGVARGAGGAGPRAQALEGAPAQLIVANFKKIRPRQISKVTSWQCAGLI